MIDNISSAEDDPAHASQIRNEDGETEEEVEKNSGEGKGGVRQESGGIEEQEEGEVQTQAGNIGEKMDNEEEKMAKGEEMPPLDKKSNNDIRQKADGEEEEKDKVEGVQIDMVLKFSIGQIKRLCENTGQIKRRKIVEEGEKEKIEEEERRDSMMVAAEIILTPEQLKELEMEYCMEDEEGREMEISSVCYPVRTQAEMDEENERLEVERRREEERVGKQREQRKKEASDRKKKGETEEGEEPLGGKKWKNLMEKESREEMRRRVTHFKIQWKNTEGSRRKSPFLRNGKRMKSAKMKRS